MVGLASDGALCTVCPVTKARAIPIRQLRESISGFLEEVAFGEARLVVTFHGRPRAAIVPLADLERLEALAPEQKKPRRRSPRAK